MIIQDKMPARIAHVYAQRLESLVSSERKAAVAGGDREDLDRVEISSEALTMQKSIEAAMAAEDVCWEKVMHLRQQIEQGKYAIPIHALAQRLLAEG